jgi:transcriptional regulator with XRE-family HTH domain
MNIKKTIGSQVYRLRKQRGWTQAQLAEKLDLTNETVSRVEGGKSGISLDLLEKILAVFEISAVEFWSGESKLLPPNRSQNLDMHKIVSLLETREPGEIRRVRRALEILLDKS